MVDNIQSYSTTRRICKYDVFISFRGPDTRNGFVDHLYNHLIRKGIFAFKDDESLQKGETISSELRQAIEGSRISIVVFSKGYADSKWCLDEMAFIAECKKELKQKVFPIFYGINPSDLRNCNGLYHDAFVSHKAAFRRKRSKVNRWMSAMNELANLAGWEIMGDKKEFGEIENIVKNVIRELRHKFSGLVDDLIGIQSRVEELEKLLNSSAWVDGGFRALGVWGMGGIGKTTLAAALYDKISYQFDASCFIENVSKIYGDGGAVAVQKQILRQTLDEKNLETYSPFEISGIITNRLYNVKALIVLDNVDQLEELEELHIKSLGARSRLIITTRNMHILKVYGVDAVYEVPLLNHSDARKLLCRKAFKSDDSSSSYMEMIDEVLKYVECLPLAIKVLGSFLCTREMDQWRATLDGLRNNPNRKITKVLQTSVEGLEKEYKEIFLHIACFFTGEREDYVSRILASCDLAPHIGIPVMIERSFITIRNQEIHMHEMLQELGKSIVREQFPNNPGMWSRMWLYHDFFQVMVSQTGTENIEAIVLKQNGDVFKQSVLEAGEFSRMKNLKLLILHHEKFSGNFNFLSNGLHYFMWQGFPFTSLPSSFQPYNIVELNMPNSNIKCLWEDIKYLPFLKVMDLSDSKYIEKTPNFQGIRMLERLDLSGCTNLREVHSSIGFLDKLVFLSLRNCCSLVKLIHLNSSLQILHLSGCTSLRDTPRFSELSNLEYLDLERCTSLSMVDDSIWKLQKLRFLSLRGCINLLWISVDFSATCSLVTLDLCGCVRLENLDMSACYIDKVWEDMSACYNDKVWESIIFLDLGSCNLSLVPEDIGELRYLERLNLQGNKFVSLPEGIGNLLNLAYLNLAHCHELQHLPRLLPRQDRYQLTHRGSSAGKYFKAVSGSRNHRSGLYIFDCRNCHFEGNLALSWLFKLVREPMHFRCGFDIVVPGSVCPNWFNYQFEEDSIVRIVHCGVHDNWIGFAFCVAFKARHGPGTNEAEENPSPSPVPHPSYDLSFENENLEKDLFPTHVSCPFYLSFETEEVEETFNMPLCLDLGKIGGSEHLWLIYISRPHCHFAKSGAHISFKAHPDLEIIKWGLRMVFDQGVVERMVESSSHQDSQTDNLPFSYVHESSGSSGPKIQLPYNWLVTDQEENENMEAKGKEDNVSYVGLRTSLSKRHKASSSR